MEKLKNKLHKILQIPKCSRTNGLRTITYNKIRQIYKTYSKFFLEGCLIKSDINYKE